MAKRSKFGRNPGGLSLFVSVSLYPAITEINVQDSNIIAIKVMKTWTGFENDLIIIACYIPPEGNKVYDTLDEDNGINILSNTVEWIRNKYVGCPLLIMGDLNARTGQKQDFAEQDSIKYMMNETEWYEKDSFNIKRSSLDTVNNKFGDSLIDMCLINNIHMLNGRAGSDKSGQWTFISGTGKSLIDYMLLSSTLFDNIIKFEVDSALTISDHFPLKATLKLNKDPLQQATIGNRWIKFTPPKTETGKQKFINAIHTEQYLTDLGNAGQKLEELDIEGAIQHINIAIQTAAKEFSNIFPKSASIKVQPPWWDHELATLKKHKYRKLNKFLLTGLNENRKEYIHAKKRFQNKYRQKEFNFQNDRNQRIAMINNCDDFWKELHKCKMKPQDERISLEEWSNYFTTLLGTTNIPENPDLVNVLTTHDETCNICHMTDSYTTHLNDKITQEEVSKIIRNLPRNKAPGTDGLMNEFLIMAADSITPILTDTFNVILETGIYPSAWSEGLICPIHKKGDKSDPNNYRGITLLNSMPKIFSSIINNRLTTWCNEENLLKEEQCGFRKGYSTIDNIFNLTATIQKYLSKRGGRFYVIFVDFSKAFDSVQHNHLWVSLLNNRIHGKILNIIRSMYSQIKSRVKTKHGLTEAFTNYIGTMQGDVLSPLLFILYLNEFVDQLKSNNAPGIYISEEFPCINILLYADDLSELADTVGRLQSLINELETYTTKWGMKVNVDKTKIMVFRNGGKLRKNEKWLYEGNPLEVVSYFRYLGLLLSSRLSWGPARKSLAIQAEKALHYVKSVIHKRNTPAKTMLQIFDRMIAPILYYGAELWGYEPCQQIENIQIKFCRYLLGVNTHTPNAAVLGELGRFPLYTEYATKCIKYWCKLQEMEHDRLPSASYQMLYQYDNVGRTTWASHIKTLLQKTGFGFVWDNQSVGDTEWFTQIFKQRLKDMCEQDWLSEINNSRKLQTYSLFKTELKLESYLTMNLPRLGKALLTKLRCATLKLQIEMGRYENIMKEQRICNLCKEEIEDEYHFIMKCKILSNIRSKQLSNITEPANLHTFIMLMKSECYKIKTKLVLYMQEAWEHRCKILT